MSDRQTTGNPTDQPVLTEIQQRWSPVCFDGSTVDEPTLHTLLEAARWAASCFNDQPWHFVVASRDDRAHFDALLECLVEANREWAQHASVLLLVVANQKFRHNGKSNRWSWFDCGQATAQLMLEAVHQGLRSHAMAGFDADAARASCGLSDDQDPACFVAIGRVGGHEAHTDAMRDRDAAENQRIAIADLVSRQKIGTPSPIVASPSVAT